MSNPYAPPSAGGRPDPGAGTSDGAPPPTEAPSPPPVEAPPTTPPRAGPDPGADPPPARPPRAGPPPPDPAKVRESTRQVMHFGLAMLACLVTSTLPLPWQIGALAFALLAMVMGIRALRSVWVSGARGAMVPALSIGLAFAAVLTLSMVTSLAMWPLQMDRQSCLRDALTISAQEQCEAEFRDAAAELSIFSGE